MVAPRISLSFAAITTLIDSEMRSHCPTPWGVPLPTLISGLHLTRRPTAPTTLHRSMHGWAQDLALGTGQPLICSDVSNSVWSLTFVSECETAADRSKNGGLATGTTLKYL